MSSDKKENTKSLSGFGFNVDSDNSKFTEIPTITNLLGRKKFQKKDPASAPKIEEDEKTSPTHKGIELTDAPKEAFYFKTSTGFNTYQQKDGTAIKVERKKIQKKRGGPTATLSVIQSKEFLELGASTLLYMKKNEKGHFAAHAYHGANHLKNTWAGMELKKTNFPEFFQFAEIETTMKPLQTLHSYQNILVSFNLHPKHFHYFIPDFTLKNKFSFFILSAEKNIENELKNFFSQSTSKRAA